MLPVMVPAKDDRLHVVIDTREKTGKGWTFEPKQVSVVRKALPSGDYSVVGLEDRVALERKTLGDLVQTVIHDWLRFRKELNRLSAFDVAAICVEANIGQVYRHEYESDALPASILGRVNGIFLDHGIPVFWWEDRKFASDMAHRLLLQAWRKLHHDGPDDVSLG